MPMISDDGGRAVLIAVKAVPGASHDAFAGVLGERLKIRVAAPPEGGRANNAIARLLAEALGIRPSSVALVAGGSSPMKTFRASGVNVQQAQLALSRFA